MSRKGSSYTKRSVCDRGMATAIRQTSLAVFHRVEVDDLVLKKGAWNAHNQRVAGREYRITEAT